MSNKVKILSGEYDLELLIGAIKKKKDAPASEGYELAFRWDEDMLVRKLKAKLLEKFWNDFDVKPFLWDYKNLRKAKNKFLQLLELSVREIVDEFVEEVSATKVK
jgi:hypothetical protein